MSSKSADSVKMRFLLEKNIQKNIFFILIFFFLFLNFMREKNSLVMMIMMFTNKKSNHVQLLNIKLIEEKNRTCSAYPNERICCLMFGLKTVENRSNTSPISCFDLILFACVSKHHHIYAFNIMYFKFEFYKIIAVIAIAIYTYIYTYIYIYICIYIYVYIYIYMYI
jgi:hypothetical protein